MQLVLPFPNLGRVRKPRPYRRRGGGSSRRRPAYRFNGPPDQDPQLKLTWTPPPRKRHRNSRARDVQAAVLSAKQLRRDAEESGRMNGSTLRMLERERPRTRLDCLGADRPCPWVGCKHHLYLDVNEETGAIKVNFPDLEVWELEHSCALDVADRGSITYEAVAVRLNLTRERVRQLLLSGTAKVQHGARFRGLDRMLGQLGPQGGSGCYGDDDCNEDRYDEEARQWTCA